MGNEMSMDDPALSCPLLDRLPTKDELMDIVPPDGDYTNMLSYCLNNWDSQRQLDLRWALLCANQGDTKSRTFAQWKELYKKSGMDLVSTSSRHRSKELLDFPQLNKSSSYTLLKNFVLPKTIPRKCDHCDALLETPKFCICGETYCNEYCRGKEKENHKRPCELVQENNNTAMKLIVQWQRTQGITTTNVVVPREEVLVSRTTLRDNIVSFGGLKVVGDVFNVYVQMLDPARIPDLRNLANGNGPSAVHASYLYGKICNDPAVKAAPKKQAQKYIQSAADQGLGPAWVVLGNISRDNGDIKTAKECWLRALGICRIPEAAYNLGVMYGLGYDGPKDYGIAIDFYQEAVDSPLPHCGNRMMPNEVADQIFYSIYTANNENQSVFVSQARNNLRVVRRSCKTPAKVIRHVDPTTTSSMAINNNTSDAQPEEHVAKNKNTTHTQPEEQVAKNNNATDTRPKKHVAKTNNTTDTQPKEHVAKTNNTTDTRPKEHVAKNNNTARTQAEEHVAKNNNTTRTQAEEADMNSFEEVLNSLGSLKLSYVDDSNVKVSKEDVQDEENVGAVAKGTAGKQNRRKKKKNRKNKKNW